MKVQLKNLLVDFVKSISNKDILVPLADNVYRVDGEDGEEGAPEIAGIYNPVYRTLWMYCSEENRLCIYEKRYLFVHDKEPRWTHTESIDDTGVYYHDGGQRAKKKANKRQRELLRMAQDLAEQYGLR